MIAIIDYGAGNLFSLRCSLEYIGVKCMVTGKAADIKAADKIILPGVGAFGDAMDALRETGLDEVIISEAKSGKPLFGICLGMQLLYEKSFEHGEHNGLGLIPGDVVSLADKISGQNLKVPHMGWNSLSVCREHMPPEGVNDGDFVYYVHSFYAPVSEYTAAYSTYGTVDITGICVKDNIIGAQFHPEKSGETGLKIIAGLRPETMRSAMP